MLSPNGRRVLSMLARKDSPAHRSELLDYLKKTGVRCQRADMKWQRPVTHRMTFVRRHFGAVVDWIVRERHTVIVTRYGKVCGVIAPYDPKRRR